MTREQLEKFVHHQIRRHLTGDWGFRWSGAKRRLGHCRPDRREIGLSRHVITVSEAQQRDTVLHEVAHAIDVERRGSTRHDLVWKGICREIGARPQRLADEAMEVPFKWRATCARCGARALLHRRSRSWLYGTHAGCGGRFSFALLGP